MTGAWVTVHARGGGGQHERPGTGFSNIFFFIFFCRKRMAAAVPSTKTSMFQMSDERMTQLNNRMTAQYSGVTVIDDGERKRVAPTIVRSARWVQSQMGAAGFPIRVDHEVWRCYL